MGAPDLLALAGMALSRTGQAGHPAGPAESRSFQRCPTVPAPRGGTAGQLAESGRNPPVSAVPHPLSEGTQAGHLSRDTVPPSVPPLLPVVPSVPDGGTLGGQPGQALLLPPASPDQAEAERQDRAAIAAEGAPAATVPVDAGTLAGWEADLAELLAAAPAQRITDPEKAAAYFGAEARRRLAHVRHDRQAAGLLMGFWRHARGRMT